MYLYLCISIRIQHHTNYTKLNKTRAELKSKMSDAQYVYIEDLSFINSELD